MKYLTLVFIAILFSCEQNKISGNEYTIIGFNPSENYWIFENAQPTDLTRSEIELIEKIISERVSKSIRNYTDELIKYNSDSKSKPENNAYSYFRQYVPAINQEGEKVVWINFFCERKHFEKWKTKIVNVRDGGNCFFNLKVNLSKKEYYEYRQNSVAEIKNRCITPCINHCLVIAYLENPIGFPSGVLYF